MANVDGKFYSGTKGRIGTTPESPSDLEGVQPFPINPPGSNPSHDPVTLGTPANGLSLSGQQLSLGLSSSSTIGALSSTDWNTFNSKIGGTIASGQVAFGTGSGVIGGDSGLTWDNVNKRLGVGTPIPVSKLELYDSIGAILTLTRADTVVVSGDIIGQFDFKSLDSTDPNVNARIKTVKSGISTPSVPMDIVFETGIDGTILERARITSTGNVGIGTTAPTNTLDVNGTARIRSIANASGNFLTTSATGVIQQRSASEVGADIGAVLITGDQPIAGIKTFTTQVSVTGSYLSLSPLPDNRSKIRLFGTSFEYGIGTQSASTFGRLNNTAVTFNVPNTDTQGWLWGDSGHTLPSQGSMSLTSNGNLTIANSLRIGYGESDVDDAVSYKLDHNGTVRLAGIPSGTIVDTLGLDADNQVVKGTGGGGISGLTTNRVPKATSGTTIGDSRLIDDGTSAYFSNQNSNTFFGLLAGGASDLANRSQTAFGYQSARVNSTGINWTSIGHHAAFKNTTGNSWTAVGHNAGYNNTVGNSWVAIGSGAGGNTTTNINWIALGVDAAFRNTTGSSWISIGYQSASYYSGGFTSATSFSNGVYIGQLTKVGSAGATNEIVIGHNAEGQGSNKVVLGNTSIIKTILRGTINAANLPTSSAGLVAGDIWNDSGILKIV